MVTKKFLIIYHNLKMLLTLDLNKLIEIIIDQYGENVLIEFVSMTQNEKEKSSKVDAGILKIVERFKLYESDDAGNKIRRKDIEEKAIREGLK